MLHVKFFARCFPCAQQMVNRTKPFSRPSAGRKSGITK